MRIMIVFKEEWLVSRRRGEEEITISTCHVEMVGKGVVADWGEEG